MPDEEGTRKKKRNSSRVWKIYQVKDKEVKRPKFCPRCGNATIMAEHKDRWHCGKCGYTIFKKEK